MPPASDRTDDTIIVPPGEEEDELTGTPVIRASIVHDDEQDETNPDEGRHPEPEAQAASSDLPRRAWIPDRPMPGSGRSDQPIAAQTVPAQRPPFEAEAGQEPAVAPEPVVIPDVEEAREPEASTEAEEPHEPAAENPWPKIQSMFVDDPRRAVEQSAKVTSTALADLITAAKEVEQTLRGDWSRDRTGTEELRVALRGYRDLSARIATLTREFQRS
jgi:hypothetical protein